MNAIQLLPGPLYNLQPRLDLPYVSQNRRYLFTFNSAKFSICCNKSAASLSTPTLERTNVTQLLVEKYGLTEESIANAFQQCNNIADSTATRNVEHSLRLLQAEGLTSAQIRKVVNYNPRVFLLDPDKNIKVKLNFLKTFMKQKDLIKLVSVNPRLFNYSIKSRLKPAISFLQTLGYEGEALSELLGSVPGIVTFSEETILRLVKQAEAFGHTKGSPMFAVTLNSIGGLKEDVLEQKMQHLYSLGFSEQQVLFLCKRMPQILTVSKEKVTRNLDFLVNSAGLSLSDVAKQPILLTYSLKARLIPRYRVLEALKSMDVLKNLPSFPTVVRMTEDCFLYRYILPYAKSSSLQNIYAS